MVKIGVDIISGESDIKDLIKGCVDAVKEEDDIEVVAIGKKELFSPFLKQKSFFWWDNSKNMNRISILDASEVITMEDNPLRALKEKKNSSIVVGLEAHKRMEIDAFFSPGNTGAIVVAASIIMGRTKGVKKPALATVVPNRAGKVNLLLDVGASAECDVNDLVKFAIMGRIYFREMLGVRNPKIGLLNIGSESHKGSALLRETHKRLSAMDVNFIGNVEGRDIFIDKADVIVADGLNGNNTLKVMEGTAQTITAILSQSIKSDPMATIAIPLYQNAIKKLKEILDPETYGGVPLLGMNGNIFIGHGTSGRKAIKQGILAAAKAVRHDLLGNINRRLEELHLVS